MILLEERDDTMRKITAFFTLACALGLGLAGCSAFGLFGPKGPRTVTLFFSNETIGELKPCG